MDIDRMTSYVSRAFTFFAFLFLVLAVLAKLLPMVGGHIPGVPESPRVMLEWGVMLEVFVIPLLLRQIREQLRKPGH